MTGRFCSESMLMNGFNGQWLSYEGAWELGTKYFSTKMRRQKNHQNPQNHRVFMEN